MSINPAEIGKLIGKKGGLLGLCLWLSCSSGNPTGDGALDPAVEGQPDLPTDGADPATDSPPDSADPPPPLDAARDDLEDCTQDMDILFVLDVSTSMTFVLDRLSSGIEEVWSYALTFSDEVDYRPEFGLVVFVDDILVTNGGLPYDSAAALRSEFDRWRDFTSSDDEPGGSPGYNDDCPENAIDALYAGATQFPWRPGALHIIIFATDDTFKENPDTLGSADLVVQHTYLEVLSEVLASEIRVAAFAAHVGVCWDRNDAEPGYFSPYDGNPPLPEATGASVFDIQDVASGTISLTESIKNVILDEWCTPFII